MLKSIRWSLQLWHASLLALVLIGFGAVSYYGISRAAYDQVDTELSRLSQQVAGALRPDGGGGPGGPRGRGRGPGPGPGPDWRGDFGRGPRGRPDDRFGPPPEPDSVWVDLQPGTAQHFGDEPGMAYYIIWNRDGKVLASSRELTDVPDPGPRTMEWMGPPNLEPPQLRQRADVREAISYGPFGAHIVVGRSVAVEQIALRRDVILLAAAGGGVLLLGLLGGWLITLTVLRPIHAIAETAQEISATNLSRRIDVSATQSELGTLGAVLNDMFARLDSAFQQQVRFTADASHELRTPLSVIHTHTQLALSRDRSPEEYRKSIATCLRAANRMKDLVESLLLLARTDAGRLTLDRQPFDLRDVVEECITMVTPLATEKKVTIEADLQPLELTADASRIAQVSTNLLTNAIRYNREGGQVRVMLRAEGDEAVLSVADTGVGVPPEHQEHLFERFYRVDVARSRDMGGSGLGLAICKSIVDAHGGKISLESEVDKGTTFTIRLPLSDSKPA